jgi:exodeoxyribonuclease-3
MKIATWNVNSMNVRLPHVLEWLGNQQPDVLVLQEIKQLTENFPAEALEEIGYHSIASGQNVNLYVPNGSEVGSDKYKYKLDWLAALRGFLESELAQHENLVVLGDFNIAPADEDVYDPEKWGDAILCSPLERQALGKLIDLGLTDVFRQFEQPEGTFSWWDYRAAGFRRNAGLRIDLILASNSLTGCCTASYVDKEPRAWERPSDHAPVVAEFSK